MRIQVVSDGTATGTRVIDLDTAEDVTKYVHAVEWTHRANQLPEARVTFIAAALDYVGEARTNVQAVVEKEALV